MASADILPVLASRYKLGIISVQDLARNISPQRLEQNNILHFLIVHFSDETGYSKPHPESFEKCLQELGQNTSGALHIGDIEATDIVVRNNLVCMLFRFAVDSTATLQMKF
jgi:HAD superfamily hydrolase (TIGR01549 family)